MYNATTTNFLIIFSMAQWYSLRLWVINSEVHHKFIDKLVFILPLWETTHLKPVLKNILFLIVKSFISTKHKTKIA